MANSVISSSAAEDDICIWTLGANFAQSFGTPSGFTNLELNTGQYSMAYKQLASGDPGATISDNTGTYQHAHNFVIRPDYAVGSINVLYSDAQGTTGNPATRTIDVSAAVYPTILFASYYSRNDHAFTTFSLTATQEQFANTSLAWMRSAIVIQNSGFTDLDVDAADNGNANSLCLCALEIVPA